MCLMKTIFCKTDADNKDLLYCIIVLYCIVLLKNTFNACIYKEELQVFSADCDSVPPFNGRLSAAY